MIIGITGKSGVGKSTHAEKFAKENGCFVIHIDDIGHKVLESDDIKNKLLELFGEDSVVNGLVDRKYIGDLVFANRHLYKSLSDIVWNSMKNEIDILLNSHSNVILDWILLPHTHYWKMCDKKILVVADESERKVRVMSRDNISTEYLAKRDSAGINYDSIEFDEIIENKYD